MVSTTVNYVCSYSSACNPIESMSSDMSCQPVKLELHILKQFIYRTFTVCKPIDCSDGLRTGRLGFDSWQRHEIFLYSTSFGASQGPIELPAYCVPVYRDPSSEIRRPGPEAGYSSPSSAEVKNHLHCIYSTNYAKGKGKVVPVLN
jgi:hypothetical protein